MDRDGDRRLGKGIYKQRDRRTEIVTETKSVCERERERDRQTDREREKEREREKRLRK